MDVDRIRSLICVICGLGDVSNIVWSLVNPPINIAVEKLFKHYRSTSYKLFDIRPSAF